MNRFFNWKSLTLVLTIVSVVVPVWIWRADLNSRSLKIRIASQVSLHPDNAASISGLQVAVDGVPLKSPYLSVLELSNDGEKPIQAGDFEAPLEVRIAEGSSLARAQVTESKPRDVEAALTWEVQSIKIKPLLLNPKDVVTISILTAGSKPQFTTRARIAGISTVPVDDSAGKQSRIQSGMIAVTYFFGALLLLIASNVTGVNLTSNEPVLLRKRAAILVSTSTGVTAVAIFIALLDNLGITALWQGALALTMILSVAIPFGVLWNWNTTPPAQK